MNVSFIVPKSEENLYRYFLIPNIGVLYLATIVKEHGYNVKIYEENVKPVLDSSNNIDKNILDSDIVCISIMTANANRGYRIADIIKAKKHGMKIIFGGSHASMMAEEAIKHGDCVVIGEAEEMIIDLIENPKEGIIKGKIIENLDKLPFPDLSLIQNIKRRLKLLPMSTSRGCPYGCKFCSVTRLFGGRYRFRSAENIIEELKQREKEGFRDSFFYDDNFAANTARAKKLLQEMIDNRLRIRWGAQNRVDVARDDELLNLIKESNCSILLIGLESVNQKTLQEYNKKQEMEDIIRCINKIHENKLRIHGMFVLGSDNDDENTFRETVDFCNKYKINMAQFTILSPLPGTDVYRELSEQNRIFSKDWSLYDGSHIVFKPKKISAYDLQMKYVWLWRKFYNIRKGVKAFLVNWYVSKWEKTNKDFVNGLKNI